MNKPELELEAQRTHELNMDALAFQTIKQMFPNSSDEEIELNIAIGKQEARTLETRLRHQGLTMSNWDLNANYPGGIE